MDCELALGAVIQNCLCMAGIICRISCSQHVCPVGKAVCYNLFSTVECCFVCFVFHHERIARMQKLRLRILLESVCWCRASFRTHSALWPLFGFSFSYGLPHRIIVVNVIPHCFKQALVGKHKVHQGYILIYTYLRMCL